MAFIGKLQQTSKAFPIKMSGAWLFKMSLVEKWCVNAACFLQVTALVKLKECEDTHLGEEVDRNWSEVATQQYVFDRLNREVKRKHSHTSEKCEPFLFFSCLSCSWCFCFFLWLVLLSQFSHFSLFLSFKLHLCCKTFINTKIPASNRVLVQSNYLFLYKLT